VISLVVIAEDGSHRTEWFHKPEVMFGRVSGNDVVLASSAVSKRHARLVLKDGKHIIVDLKSTNGTFVNNRRLASPLVITETDHIHIGTFRIEIVPYDARPHDDDDTVKVDIVELRLLANVATHEPGAREVYADWLDERGDAIRAEYVRLSDQLAASTGDVRAGHQRRLGVIGERLDPEWRIKLARPAIENCDREHCPGDWGELSGSRELMTRSCTHCQRRVLYSTEVVHAHHHVRQGFPVVLDLSCPRSRGDLRSSPTAPAPLAPIPRARRETRPGVVAYSPPPRPAQAQPAEPEPMMWRPGRCGGEPDATD
jgi:uncharacterized protein (TIGR02996 family)